jgi:hypothetical protein
MDIARQDWATYPLAYPTIPAAYNAYKRMDIARPRRRALSRRDHLSGRQPSSAAATDRLHRVPAEPQRITRYVSPVNPRLDIRLPAIIGFASYATYITRGHHFAAGEYFRERQGTASVPPRFLAVNPALAAAGPFSSYGTHIQLALSAHYS